MMDKDFSHISPVLPLGHRISRISNLRKKSAGAGIGSGSISMQTIDLFMLEGPGEDEHAFFTVLRKRGYSRNLQAGNQLQPSPECLYEIWHQISHLNDTSLTRASRMSRAIFPEWLRR